MVLTKIGSGFHPASIDDVVIRNVTFADLRDALQEGWDDFKAVPSHAIMLALIYPVVGLMLARMVQGMAVLPLLFPLAAGFALLGPFAALGLYELSRRREMGEQPTASDALKVFSSPALPSIRIDAGHTSTSSAPRRACTRSQGSKGRPSSRVHRAYRSIGISG